MLLLVLMKLVSRRLLATLHPPCVFSPRRLFCQDIVSLSFVLFSGILVDGVFVLNIDVSPEHVHVVKYTTVHAPLGPEAVLNSSVHPQYESEQAPCLSYLCAAELCSSLLILQQLRQQLWCRSVCFLGG